MHIFVTRKIPEAGITMLRDKGYEVDVSEKDGVLEKDELISALSKKPYDAVLCLLTDTIDTDVLDAAPNAKIFANYAVGFDNVDVKAAKERGITITNTPDVLTDTVAEHTFALMLAISHRIVEADRFTRAGKYDGWAPELLLGNDLSGKTIGVVGLGRIGTRVAEHAVKGFGARVLYNDLNQNEEFEREYGAEYKEHIDDLLAEVDYVSFHVPLLDSTRHLLNAERLKKMKSSAYVVNTSRGAVLDEAALAEALKNGDIKGAALDVFENEPELTPGLAELDNVIVTPHIASGTEETRNAMSELAAENIVAVLEGREPKTPVK